jgi:hypothetical protein
MDLAVRSEDGTLVHPWLTLLADMHTKAIIGADVSAEAADHGSALRCLKKAVPPSQPSKEHSRR